MSQRHELCHQEEEDYLMCQQYRLLPQWQLLNKLRVHKYVLPKRGGVALIRDLACSRGQFEFTHFEQSDSLKCFKIPQREPLHH